VHRDRFIALGRHLGCSVSGKGHTSTKLIKAEEKKEIEKREVREI